MQHRLAIAILVTGIIECLILVAIALAPVAEGAAGLAHPELPGVMMGGDGAARLADISSLGFAFQVVVLVQCHLLIALGVGGPKTNASMLIALTACLGVALFVWWNLFGAYQHYLETGETGYVAGFPTATAWQVYAIWLGGLSLVALYVVGFRRFIWSEEDEAQFQQLVESHKQQD